jgi:integrase
MGDGRWRCSGPPRYTFTERSEELAIARFREWEAKHRSKSNTGTVKVYSGPDVATAGTADVLARIEALRATGGRIIITESDDEKSVAVSDGTLSEANWAWLRTQIIDRPLWVAERVGIREIGYLADLPKPTPSPTLTQLGNLYLENAKISPNWRVKVKQFWDEFVGVLGVTNLREVTQEAIVDYADFVMSKATSPAFSRQRFGAVKSVINFAPKRAKWTDHCKRAYGYCSVLRPSKKAATDPKPISPGDFANLYNAAGDVMKAMLLLMLNGCMYAGEAAVLNWSDLDLEKSTMVTARNKTGVTRIATLWPITVDVLRKLPRQHGVDAIFQTEIGTQADYLSVYRLFKPIRIAVKLAQIQLAQIRDGSYTAAVEAGTDLNLCKLLAGHAVGISDHYVKRRPQMVMAACEAISKAYLPAISASNKSVAA